MASSSINNFNAEEKYAKEKSVACGRIELHFIWAWLHLQRQENWPRNPAFGCRSDHEFPVSGHVECGIACYGVPAAFDSAGPSLRCIPGSGSYHPEEKMIASASEPHYEILFVTRTFCALQENSKSYLPYIHRLKSCVFNESKKIGR